MLIMLELVKPSLEFFVLDAMPSIDIGMSPSDNHGFATKPRIPLRRAFLLG